VSSWADGGAPADAAVVTAALHDEENRLSGLFFADPMGYLYGSARRPGAASAL